MIVKIHLENPEPRMIRKAAELLAAGGIVIYPTDTVYGLGCSVENKNALVNGFKDNIQDVELQFHSEHET